MRERKKMRLIGIAVLLLQLYSVQAIPANLIRKNEVWVWKRQAMDVPASSLSSSPFIYSASFAETLTPTLRTSVSSSLGSQQSQPISETTQAQRSDTTSYASSISTFPQTPNSITSSISTTSSRALTNPSTTSSSNSTIGTPFTDASRTGLSSSSFTTTNTTVNSLSGVTRATSTLSSIYSDPASVAAFPTAGIPQTTPTISSSSPYRTSSLTQSIIPTTLISDSYSASQAPSPAMTFPESLTASNSVTSLLTSTSALAPTTKLDSTTMLEASSDSSLAATVTTESTPTSTTPDASTDASLDSTGLANAPTSQLLTQTSKTTDLEDQPSSTPKAVPPLNDPITITKTVVYTVIADTGFTTTTQELVILTVYASGDPAPQGTQGVTVTNTVLGPQTLNAVVTTAVIIVQGPTGAVGLLQSDASCLRPTFTKSFLTLASLAGAAVIFNYV